MKIEINRSLVVKALFLAALWAAVVLFATFPSAFAEGAAYLSHPFSYDTTGIALLLATAVFVLDFGIQLAYMSSKTEGLRFLTGGVLGCMLLCVLLIPFSTIKGLDNGVIIIMFIALFLDKAFMLYMQGYLSKRILLKRTEI